jgi:hypothetical protein
MTRKSVGVTFAENTGAVMWYVARDMDATRGVLALRLPCLIV